LHSQIASPEAVREQTSQNCNPLHTFAYVLFRWPKILLLFQGYTLQSIPRKATSMYMELGVELVAPCTRIGLVTYATGNDS
jgi:hypothetical protein